MSSDEFATKRIHKFDGNVCTVIFQAGLASSIGLGVGAILAPGKRTLSALLRVMGLDQECHFQNYPGLMQR